MTSILLELGCLAIYITAAMAVGAWLRSRSLTHAELRRQTEMMAARRDPASNSQRARQFHNLELGRAL